MTKLGSGMTLFALVLGACGARGGSGDEEPGSTTNGWPGTGSGADSAGSDGSAGTTTGGDGDGDGDGERFDVGESGGTQGSAGDGGGMDCGGLVATIRDFPASHPDFQAFWGTAAATGMVEPNLDGDRKPVYSGTGPGLNQMTSQEAFDQWYRDVAGINESFEIDLPLTDNGDGTFTFDDQAFFPIDGMGFGDEGSTDHLGDVHNFHFTTEVRVEFVYQTGQSFTFTGDDDLWMFINGALVIDLGGLHPALNATVDLDTLGLQAGETYPMEIFHAERSTDRSTFRVDTSIDCFTPPPAG